MKITNKAFIEYLISNHGVPLAGDMYNGQKIRYVDFDAIQSLITNPDALIMINDIEKQEFKNVAIDFEFFTTRSLIPATSILKTKSEVEAEIQRFLSECT
jgi:hypothetical protein